MEIGGINLSNQLIQNDSISQIDNIKSKTDDTKNEHSDDKKTQSVKQSKITDNNSNNNNDKPSSDVSLTYTHLKFEIQPKTKEIMVKVIDDKTGKVIREIPPKKLMDMLVGMMTTKGNLLDSRI